MEIKKDIGKAFREKLDNLDRMPNDALWDSISKDLDTKKKRKFPLFWFSIFSLLATVGIVFILTHFYPDNNVSGTKQDSHQNDNPAYSPATTGSSNSLENKSTPKDTDTNDEANYQTNADKIIVTRRTDTDTASSTYKKTNTTEKNNIRRDNKGKSIDGTASSKTSRYKNNTAAQKGSKQKTQYPEGIAEGNTTKTGSKSKKRPAAYSSKAATTIESDKGTTKSGYTETTSISKRRRQKTATQSQITKQTADSESGKQTATASAKTVIAPSDVTGSEIVSPEGMSLTTHDSLPENTIVVKDSLKTEVPKEEIAEEKEEPKKDSLAPAIFKRFSAFTYGGPSFFNFPESTIQTDSTTASVTTSNTIRYGVLFGYRINEKLSIRTGFAVSRLKQTAKDMKLSFYMFFSNTGSSVDMGIMPPPPIEGIAYASTYYEAHTRVINEIGYSEYAAIINIERKLSYLEIPLEISYTLIDKKFGLSIFGGGSLLFLTKNEVYAYNDKGKIYLGKWNAVSKTSLTGILGFGLHYNFSPSLQLNAEPTLNYYFNTYKDSKPYSYTMRLGLQYNFDIGSTKK